VFLYCHILFLNSNRFVSELLTPCKLR